MALAVSRACEELTSSDQIDQIILKVSDGVYKNGMTAGIPGIHDTRGNAAALCGNSRYGLEALRDCSLDIVEEATKWVNDGRIVVERAPGESGIFVEATVILPTESSTCVIAGAHSRIAEVRKSGRTVLQRSSGADEPRHTNCSKWVQGVSFGDVFALSKQCTSEDIDYILKGIAMNLEIAEYGLRNPSSAGCSYAQSLLAPLEGTGSRHELGSGSDATATLQS